MNRFTKCRTCKGGVSRTAAACPHCGDSKPTEYQHSPKEYEDVCYLLKELPLETLAPVFGDGGEFQNAFTLAANGGEAAIYNPEVGKMLVVLDGKGIHEEYIYSGDSDITKEMLDWYGRIISNAAFGVRLTEARCKVGADRYGMLKAFLCG